MRKAKPRKRDPKTGRLPPLTDPAVMIAEAKISAREKLRQLEKQFPKIARELDRREKAARKKRKS